MVNFEDNFHYLKKNSDLIGRDEEAKEVLYRIASSNMLLIEGEKGEGKTKLLKYAIDNFKGKGKVAYIDIGTFGKRFDVSNILKKKTKGMILLIDNIQFLSEENNKKIKYFYDQDYIKSVVFTTTDYESVNFTDAMRSRIGKNIIKLKKLEKNDVFEIAEKRLRNKYTFSEEVLDQLYENSKNLKEFLMSCDLLCDYLEKEGRVEPNLKDLNNIKVNITSDDVEICLECNQKLVRVGNHWRCKNCDDFCVACGSLYEKHDLKCPRCGIKIVRNKK